MILEAFSMLPCWVTYEGINFELQLINNGRSDDNRLVYAMRYCDDDSPHRNSIDLFGCFENRLLSGASTGFLWLYEGIGNDDEFMVAVIDAVLFLKRAGLWEDRKF